MIKTCPYCGTEFEPRQWNQRYCSDHCQQEDYYRLNRETILEKDHAKRAAKVKAKEKVCPTCGKHFTTTNVKKNYCSKACRQKAHNARRPKVELPTRYCAHCGRDFQPTANGQKYCSAECRNWHYKPKTYVKICTYCGAEFNTRRKEQTFCSSTCRRSAEFRQAQLARLGFSSKTPPAKPVTIKPAVEVVKLEPTPEVVEVQAPPVEPPKVVTPAVTAENRKPTVDELLDWIFSRGATA